MKTSSAIARYRRPKDGRVVEVYHDDDPVSPLSDATPGRFLSLANHRHVFGHEQLSSDEIDARRAEADAAGALVLPVHVHDHSGLKFSLKEFADPWDSACCGVWIASQEEMAADEMTEDDARSAIEGTLKRYSDYCNGWAYRYVVYGANNEEEDAVGGYLGCHHTMTGLLIEAGIAAETEGSQPTADWECSDSE